MSRRIPAGWKPAPKYPGGKAVIWTNPPEGHPHVWVAYPGPRGSWLIKDKATGAEARPPHVFVSLEEFENYVRANPNP